MNEQAKECVRKIGGIRQRIGTISEKLAEMEKGQEKIARERGAAIAKAVAEPDAVSLDLKDLNKRKNDSAEQMVDVETLRAILESREMAAVSELQDALVLEAEEKRDSAKQAREAAIRKLKDLDSERVRIEWLLFPTTNLKEIPAGNCRAEDKSILSRNLDEAEATVKRIKAADRESLLTQNE